MVVYCYLVKGRARWKKACKSFSERQLSCKDTFSVRCKPETHTRIWTPDEPLKSEFSVKRNLFEKKRLLTSDGVPVLSIKSTNFVQKMNLLMSKVPLSAGDFGPGS